MFPLPSFRLNVHHRSYDQLEGATCRSIPIRGAIDELVGGVRRPIIAPILRLDTVCLAGEAQIVRPAAPEACKRHLVNRQIQRWPGGATDSPRSRLEERIARRAEH